MKSRRTTREIAGAILAGGKASRLAGTPKGLLADADGIPIIEREIRELRTAGIADIIIVANDPEPYQRLQYETVADIRPGVGPLGGIEAALAYYAGRADATFFLPCDLPGITVREIRRLRREFENRRARVVVAATGPLFLEPLCAVVQNDLLSSVSRAIDGGTRRARDVWQEAGAVHVHFDDPTPFFNVNTLEDMDRWLAGKETPG